MLLFTGLFHCQLHGLGKVRLKCTSLFCNFRSTVTATQGLDLSLLQLYLLGVRGVVRQMRFTRGAATSEQALN